MAHLNEQAENQAKPCAFVIVTSDSCFKDPTQDTSGEYVKDRLHQTGFFTSVAKLIESDDKDKIISTIGKILTANDPALVITVGGTGLTPRDVTPDATSALYEKTCNGISTALHMNSLRYTPHAALSRLTAGIVGGTLIINFPGKVQACKECFGCLSVILGHALEQVRYDHVAYSETHSRQMVGANERLEQQLDMPPEGPVAQMGLSLSALSLDTTSPIEASIKNNPILNARVRQSLAANGITLTEITQSRPSSELSGRSKLSIQSIEKSRNEMSTLEQNQSSRDITKRPMRSSRPSSEMPTKRIQPKPRNPMSRTSSVVSLGENPKSKPRPKSQNQSKPQPKSQNQPNRQSQQQLQPASSKLCPLPSIKVLQTHSSYPQISYQESLDILQRYASALFDEPEPISIDNPTKAHNVIGCALAEDLFTKRLLPPFPVSTMDGYVVNIPAELTKLLDKIKSFSYYPVVDDMTTFEQMQIDTNHQKSFFCCQINTGGRLPKFNYAVVPTEKAMRHHANNSITFKELRQFVHVRGKGTDIGENDVIKVGTVIGPVELSCIIAMGHKTFKVLQRPRIGVLSTGDELKNFLTNESISLDSVIDTNGPMLRSMFRSLGYHVEYHIVGDEPQELLERISEMLKHCKVILVTGGASMGTRDHVKDVILHLGGRIHFGRVDIKPGKPAAFASLHAEGRHQFIFSLPGNPVSAFVTTLVLVLPFLRLAPARHLGFPDSIKEHLGENIWAEVHQLDRKKNSYYKFDGRLEFLRAKILTRKKEFHENSWPVYLVKLSTEQQSSRLLSLVDCDCLMMVDPEFKDKSLEVGNIFPAIRLKLKF